MNEVMKDYLLKRAQALLTRAQAGNLPEPSRCALAERLDELTVILQLFGQSSKPEGGDEGAN